MVSKILKTAIFFLLLLFPFFLVQASEPLIVVINEIAWMGTTASSADEWIELYNNTDKDIELEGWGLYEEGGKTLIEPLAGTIKAKSYYLVERTDETTVNDVPASQEPSGWGGYGLKNSGEYLQLLDQNSVIVDEIDCRAGWYAGDNKTKQTMERKSGPGSGSGSGSEPGNWQTSEESCGTPKAQNSPGSKPKEVENKKGQNSTSPEFPEAEPRSSPEARLREGVQDGDKLASLGEQVKTSSSNPLYVFLAAFIVALLSTIIVLFLKKKLTTENKPC